MSPRVTALILVATMATAGCIPAAIGTMAAGGATIGAAHGSSKGCAADGCAYTGLFELMFETVGVELLLGGGIALAVLCL